MGETLAAMAGDNNKQQALVEVVQNDGKRTRFCAARSGGK
jgi:hypothetical protein